MRIFEKLDLVFALLVHSKPLKDLVSEHDFTLRKFYSSFSIYRDLTWNFDYDMNGHANNVSSCEFYDIFFKMFQ